MKGIRILSKVDGFRRAGLRHTGVQDYPTDQFSKQQLEDLKGEPNLVVTEIDILDPASIEPKAEGGKPPGKAKVGDPAKQ